MKICFKKIDRLRYNTIYFVLGLLVRGELLSTTYRLLVNTFYKWLMIQLEGFLQSEIELLRIEIVLNFFIYLCFC